MEEEYIEPITSEEIQGIFGTNFITKENIELVNNEIISGWSINGAISLFGIAKEEFEKKEVISGKLFPHQYEEVRKLSGKKAEKKFLELVEKNKEKYNFNQC
jgi:hypothetical protein